ncbi:hypothetical protein Cgig2_013556 [Carnegiea gigantea]|uniref:At4g15545-like C-terminal domain-containing protein n=1 Tax=Carnegiea gigantea TaxID=171969 RepID=A0A9Q1GVF1_9CARY|nr:hypothetical protein Cgig2_013556 [Carnegiea gigantea]
MKFRRSSGDRKSCRLPVSGSRPHRLRQKLPADAMDASSKKETKGSEPNLKNTLHCSRKVAGDKTAGGSLAVGNKVSRRPLQRPHPSNNTEEMRRSEEKRVRRPMIARPPVSRDDGGSQRPELEVFRKTLMQSLQEEEDGSTGAQGAFAKELKTQASLSAQSQSGDDDISLPPSAYSSTQSETLESGNSVAEDHDTDASRPRISPGLLLGSQTSTPRLTPPGSPPSVSPSRTPKPTSPRRHSVSFSTSRGIFDSNHGSFSSTDGGPQSGRPRVDGKEFFRQVRSRLSYEQFGAFLANVKELNSHKQSKEETLRKADEIFGHDNKDLYTIFEGLLTRNVH